MLTINSLVVTLSLPSAEVIGKGAKHFLKEIKVRLCLPACCFPPVFDSPGAGDGGGGVFQMLAMHYSFPGISGHRNFYPAVLCIAVQQSEVAYPAQVRMGSLGRKGNAFKCFSKHKKLRC